MMLQSGSSSLPGSGTKLFFYYILQAPRCHTVSDKTPLKKHFCFCTELRWEHMIFALKSDAKLAHASISNCRGDLEHTQFCAAKQLRRLCQTVI